MKTGPTAGPGILSDRALGVVVALASAVGLVASLVLLIEKIELIKNPDYVPSCSINPILSCGSIMNTPQAELFGFPNPILGVVGFAVALTAGVSMLAGAEYRYWFWLGLQLGATLGVVLVHWLVFQSLYRIGALCPYCMIVWVAAAVVFWYVSLRNAGGSRFARSRLAPPLRVATEFHGVVLTIWGLIVAALITERFWDYWQTVVP